MLFHLRRRVLSHSLEGMLRTGVQCREVWGLPINALKKPPVDLPDRPTRPEDFRPLENACFQNPYAFYRMLRDEYPVYRLPNGIYCISRYEDIVSVSRDHENFSSNHQGVIGGLRPGQSVVEEGEKLEAFGWLGVTPVNVLALSDPPVHSSERKLLHRGLNARFVKSLEPQVEALCREMMDEFIDEGQVEFMQEFGWRLPMKLIIQLLGFPAQDYEQIKTWCFHIIAIQSGIASSADMMRGRAAAIAFMRYCWKQHLLCKKKPRDDLSGIFAEATLDSDHPMSDQSAVSGIFQLLIAGSDSSASSMGNALKLLIEHPELADEIRADLYKLPAFIEEVFRLESAFQGHFRWARNDCELHGVKLSRGSRIFLMWASGNRDDRVFANPDRIDLQRKNGKKHLTFGHGIHACIGRELARTEIRVVLREFLLRTRNLRITGDAPFQASMFARTLVRLPIAFDAVDTTLSGPDAAETLAARRPLFSGTWG
jgi:cytochrome P450